MEFLLRMELYLAYCLLKVGINVFLDGYIPSENVRFRDKKFSFDVSTTTGQLTGETIIKYPIS